MEMHIRNIILLGIDAFGGNISGKTMLQKRFYFLSELTDHDLGYHAHYFGPYSDEVADEVVALKTLNRVREECQDFGGVSQDGFEIKRFDYALTEEGKKGIEWLKQEKPNEADMIAKNAKKIKDAGSLNYVDLSIAAKAHFILKQNKEGMTPQGITQAAKKFSWDVNDKQINQAIDFLKRLGMVKTGKG